MKLKAILIILILTLAAYPAFCGEESAGEGGGEEASGPPARGAMGAMGAMGAGGGAVEGGSIGQGAGLSPLLGESFQTDLATGAATVSVPIVVPPGRKNMQPNLALSYSSNNPNGICGVGWGLTQSSVQRSTKKGAPTYDDNTDTFVFASSGSSGELVPINEDKTEFRQKIETAFMKYLYNGTSWTVYDKNGTKYTFGETGDSKISDPEEDDPAKTRIFAWYLTAVEDIHGNKINFDYEKHIYADTSGNRTEMVTSTPYLSSITYTENNTLGSELSADKRVELVYGKKVTVQEEEELEKDVKDVIYNYRSGWRVETARRLKEIRINVYDKVNNAFAWRLAWVYRLVYEESGDTQRLLLRKITLYDGEPGASGTKHLPPKVFTYQKI